MHTPNHQTHNLPPLPRVSPPHAAYVIPALRSAYMYLKDIVSSKNKKKACVLVPFFFWLSGDTRDAVMYTAIYQLLFELLFPPNFHRPTQPIHNARINTPNPDENTHQGFHLGHGHGPKLHRRLPPQQPVLSLERVPGLHYPSIHPSIHPAGGKRPHRGRRHRHCHLNAQPRARTPVSGSAAGWLRHQPRASAAAGVATCEREAEGASDAIPGEFAGRYDGVHVRLPELAIENSDLRSLLRDLIKMLKPGWVPVMS